MQSRFGPFGMRDGLASWALRHENTVWKRLKGCESSDANKQQVLSNP
jgi:hypothetical protein